LLVGKRYIVSPRDGAQELSGPSYLVPVRHSPRAMLVESIAMRNNGRSAVTFS